jgi:hypothetical protein
MVNGAFNLSSDAGNFRFQAGNALFQLIDGERIEILACQRGERVGGTAGQIIFRAHDLDR